MAEPVVYVSTWKIKEGKFDEYRRFYAKQLKLIDEAEPQIVAFLAFANEDGTEMTHIHVHPDRSSMDMHMESSPRRWECWRRTLAPCMSSWSPCGPRSSVRLATARWRWTTADRRGRAVYVQAATHRRFHPLPLSVCSVQLSEGKGVTARRRDAQCSSRSPANLRRQSVERATWGGTHRRPEERALPPCSPITAAPTPPLTLASIRWLGRDRCTRPLPGRSTNEAWSRES